MTVEDWKTPPVDSERYSQTLRQDDLQTQEREDFSRGNPEGPVRKKTKRRTDYHRADEAFEEILTGKGNPNRVLELIRMSAEDDPHDSDTTETLDIYD